MKINVMPGKYVVAVSGGVDSVVLLDALSKKPDLHLVVAHVDHGIRPDSHLDEEFVRKLAKQHSLEYETIQLNLGAKTSEAQARAKRYDFLRCIMRKHRASKIITAHHNDDLLETAIINIIRGTGWRGIAPFMSDPYLLRPLENICKDQIIGYARRHKLTWREDSTNTDEKYLRNYIRHTIIPTLHQRDHNWQSHILNTVAAQKAIRLQIEKDLQKLTQEFVSYGKESSTIRRYNIIALPNEVAYELLQFIFKKMLGNSLERALAEDAQIFAKAGLPGKIMQLNKQWQIRAKKTSLVVERS